MPFHLVFVNKCSYSEKGPHTVSAPIPMSAAILISAPILVDYIDIEINRGSFSFKFLTSSLLKVFVSASQPLCPCECIHSSFKRMSRLKILWWLLGRVVLARNYPSPFAGLLDSFEIKVTAFFSAYSAVSQKTNKHPLPYKGPVSNKCHPSRYTKTK